MHGVSVPVSEIGVVPSSLHGRCMIDALPITHTHKTSRLGVEQGSSQ